MKLGLYIRTVRYLRTEQMLARLLRHVSPRRFDKGPRPPLRVRRQGLVAPVVRPREWSSPTRVRILNVEREFPGGIEWSPGDVPRLWLYHLHYLSDLPAGATGDDSAWLREVVRSWIDSNPPGTPNAWDPYPTSLRVMNLVKWLLRQPDGADRPAGNEDAGAGRYDDGRGSDCGVRELTLQSLAVQTRHLARSLEYDISANHLFANAAALSTAGLLFDGEEGDRWLEKGSRVLWRELREQVLLDGGHYERSPMYHSIVLEHILDVLNVWQGVAYHTELRRSLEATASRMLSWLESMAHPDGEVSFFNDSTMGVAATLAQLRDYAGRLGIDTDVRPASGAGGRAVGGTVAAGVTAASDVADGAGRGAENRVTHLNESGYFRMVSEDGDTVAIFDAGPIGPDHQPGHGHCDALSLEVSRGRRRVLVNSGISTYEAGPERLRQRRTAAHNTALVDGEEQCELWSSHRCGRRHGILQASGRGASAEASHSGFAHLGGSPIHHRTVSVSNKGLLVRDGFDGEGEHLIEWFLRFHPDLTASRGPGGFTLSRGSVPVGVLSVPPEMSPRLEESTWHPGFNLSEPCFLVACSWRGRLPRDFTFELRWAQAHQLSPQTTEEP